MATKPCPACGNELLLPTEYLNSFKALKKHTDRFIPVLEKDYFLHHVKPILCDALKWLDTIEPNTELCQIRKTIETMIEFDT